MGGLLVIYNLGGIFNSEWQESYGFLQTMPVTDKEIVQSKFLISLMVVCFYWIWTLLILVFGGLSSIQFAFSASLLNCYGILALLMSGSFHFGIYRWGRRPMAVILWVTIGCVFTFTLILNYATRGLSESSYAHNPIFAFVIGIPWYAWCIVIIITLLIYRSLMNVAVQAKITSNEMI
jgi:hypothetical protein